LLLCPVGVHQLTVSRQSFIDEELLTDINLHVVAVIFLDLLVEFLCLLDHLKLLSLDLLLVVVECAFPLYLKPIEFYLPPYPVRLELQLYLTGNVSRVLIRRQLDLSGLIHIEALLVFNKLLLHLLLGVHDIINNLELLSGFIRRVILFPDLNLDLIEAVSEFIVNPVHIRLLLVEHPGFIQDFLEIHSSKHDLLAWVRDRHESGVSVREQFMLPIAFGEHEKPLVQPVLLGQVAGILVFQSKHIVRVS
jgi:hypothetical protein